MEICFHRHIKSVIIMINFDAESSSLLFIYLMRVSHYWSLKVSFSSMKSSIQVAGEQLVQARADSSTPALITLQSISAKCQETQGSSAI